MATRLQIYQQLNQLIADAVKARNLADRFLAGLGQDEEITLDPDGLIKFTITAAQKQAAVVPVFDALIAGIVARADGWKPLP